MKKVVKVILCVAVIAAVLLGFVAKYDTCGVIPGSYDGYITRHVVNSSNGVVADSQDVDVSYSGYAVYTNRFGRVVVAETTPKHAAYRNDLTDAVYKKYGPVITHVRTILPGIATHLDFVGIENSNTTIYELIARAGAPTHEVLTPDLYSFSWVTVDGYQYHVGLDRNSSIVRKLMIVYPGRTWSEEAFQTQVVIFYLVLAAILSGILVCLLVIPKRIEKRKAKKLTEG